MPTVKHILFPLDLSEAGMAAIPYVSALANQLHAKVSVVSVVPPAWIAPPGLIPPPAGSDPMALQNTLQVQLDKLPLDGIDSSAARLTAIGDPAQKIAEFTRDNAVDLVMIPTHGHGLFRRLLIGSVASKVLHDVYCPVWTAAHAEKQRAQELPRKVLCAVDGTEKTLEVARWASDFSRQIGARLQLLHVVRAISDWLSLDSQQSVQEQLQAEARNCIEASLKSGGVDLPLRVAAGEIVATIAGVAHQEDADLVVLGRGTVHETLGGLRTHLHAIIQHSPCPVLTV